MVPQNHLISRTTKRAKERQRARNRKRALAHDDVELIDWGTTTSENHGELMHQDDGHAEVSELMHQADLNEWLAEPDDRDERQGDSEEWLHHIEKLTQEEMQSHAAASSSAPVVSSGQSSFEMPLRVGVEMPLCAGAPASLEPQFVQLPAPPGLAAPAVVPTTDRSSQRVVPTTDTNSQTERQYQNLSWGPVHENPDVIFEVYGTEAHAWPTDRPLKHPEDCVTHCHSITRGRPWNDKSHHDCCGDNGYLMFLISCDDECASLLASIKYGVTHSVPPWGSREPHHHGIACAHGRHRSLGIANLGKHCLEKYHGLKVNIHILSTVQCGCPNWCKKQRSRSDYESLRVQQFKDGRAAFRVAERFWLRTVCEV
jgi:hypothetical protein